jgi:hypothetical protein
MKYTISINEKNGYVLAQVEGDLDVEQALKLDNEVDEISRKNSCYKFLFDLRLSRNISSELDNHLYANEYIPSSDYQKNVRIAFVTQINDDSHDFVATSLSNAGFTVESFKDMSLAKAWLTEKV